jgi:hypothetical protein
MLLRVVARSRQCIDMSGNIALGHKMQTYRAPRTVRKGEEREVPRPVDRAIQILDAAHLTQPHDDDREGMGGKACTALGDLLPVCASTTRYSSTGVSK